MHCHLPWGRNEQGHLGQMMWAAPPDMNSENKCLFKQVMKASDKHPEGMEDGAPLKSDNCFFSWHHIPWHCP
jgi:hypothetical protein